MAWPGWLAGSKQPEPKVFCQDCQFCKWNGDSFDWECHSEYLVYNEYDSDNAIRPGDLKKVLRTVYLSCMKLNRRNDCSWFKPRGVK